MSYYIRVDRQPRKGTGVLKYWREKPTEVQATPQVTTECWFDTCPDPKHRINPGRYDACSTTYMKRAMQQSPPGKSFDWASKDNHTDWQAIHVRWGIFIHRGGKQTRIHEWSEGCIVISHSELLKIWHDIPLNGKNVMVEIRDDASG